MIDSYEVMEHFYFVLINKQIGQCTDWWLTLQSRRNNPSCCCCGWEKLQMVFHGEAPLPDFDQDRPQTNSLPLGAPHSSLAALLSHIETWENNHSLISKRLVPLSPTDLTDILHHTKQPDIVNKNWKLNCFKRYQYIEGLEEVTQKIFFIKSVVTGRLFRNTIQHK